MTWRSLTPLLALLGAFGVLYAVDRRHRIEEAERLRAEVAALAASARARPSVTERVVVERPVYVNSPAATGSPAPPADEPPADRPPPSPADVEESARRRSEQLRASFEKEPRGGAAAARGETFLRGKIAPALAETSALESVDCRATSCRLELAHADPAASNKLLEHLFIGPESTLHGTDFLATSPEQGADGKVRVTVLVPVAQLDDAQ
jgi:hypothetical protein